MVFALFLSSYNCSDDRDLGIFKGRGHVGGEGKMKAMSTAYSLRGSSEHFLAV